jgi:rhodanese-related sulfurtransferase
MQYDAITQHLFTLPDETIVRPAHDYRGHKRSTIGEEKRSNPRLAGRSRAEYVEIMNNLGLPLPERIQEALQANQAAIEDDSVQFPPLAKLAEVRQLAPAEVQARLAAPTPPLLLDVREPDEFDGELGHVAGSRLLPLRELSTRSGEIEGRRRDDVIVVCRAGVRSATAAALLTALGFERVWNLRGEQMHDCRALGLHALGRTINVERQIQVPAPAEYDVAFRAKIADVGCRRRLCAGANTRERRDSRRGAGRPNETASAQFLHGLFSPSVPMRDRECHDHGY